eukprot:gene1614-1785_t
MYHQTCSINFRTGKQIPAMFLTDEPNIKKNKSSRPQDEVKAQAFQGVAGFLAENDNEQITINDLIELMDEYLKESECTAYGHTHMKAKLKQHFSNQILVTEINEKSNVVTLRSTAEALLQDFHDCQKKDPEMEKMHIIRTAAKFIKNDIKLVETSNEYYPPTDEIKNPQKCLSFLPESLKAFLGEIVTGKDVQLKLASIGQGIMQTSQPRVLLALLQVGLGVQLHHHFASRFLIDSLHHHGFCCSYQEVQRFEKNAAVNTGTNLENLTSETVQYVADNVDHNIRTLDGNDTFHGMGIIATITPATKQTRVVPRKTINPKDVSDTGKIDIQYQKMEGKTPVN